MKFVLATSNRGKLAELQPLLAPLNYELVTQGELGVQDAIEDGHSFIENALIKARHAARSTGLPALADDSGICVRALNGAPGLISAHYAGEHGNAQRNNALLLENLKQVADDARQAYFYCVLVFLRHAEDPQPIIAEGIWHGSILYAPHGDQGFGYDPLFFVPEHDCSAAELPADLKNRISHRGQALAMLVEKMKIVIGKN
jgi:XTP/dITP diphosphohydrolase